MLLMNSFVDVVHNLHDKPDLPFCAQKNIVKRMCQLGFVEYISEMAFI